MSNSPRNQPVSPSSEYQIPLWQGVSFPLLFGKTRGRRWLVFSGGKILRLLLGSYEVDQTSIITQRLQPGSVLFDVGAAVGYYTLLAAPLVGPEGRVVSFEPDSKNAAFLRKHVAVNRFTNVDVHQTAIGDRNGQAQFSGGTGTGTGRLTERGNFTVSLCTLDEVVRHTRMPTHIKIDVEGAELRVLHGARNLLATAKPTLFLSTHGPRVHQACCRYLTELGYKIEPMSSDPHCDSEILCTADESKSTAAWFRYRRAA